jgi:hypothetical protein
MYVYKIYICRAEKACLNAFVGGPHVLSTYAYTAQVCVIHCVCVCVCVDTGGLFQAHHIAR